jgi:UDP-N-acetylglucosamine 4,6-dehydratase
VSLHNNTYPSVAATWLGKRHQFLKRLIMGCIDLVMLLVLVLLAYDLRVSLFTLPPSDLISHYLIAAVFSGCAGVAFGIYDVSIRNYSIKNERDIVFSQTIAVIFWALFLSYLGFDRFARSVILIYLALALIGMIGMRRLAAFLFLVVDRSNSPRVDERKPIIIYGAGREGISLVESLVHSRQYKVVALIDDDHTVIGRKVAEMLVLPMSELSTIITRKSPTEVVFAKPQLVKSKRREVVQHFIGHGFKVKIIPDLAEIISGRLNLSEIRDVNLEDLLGRDPVPPDQGLMNNSVKGRVVMVTGAGGSIGSEITRQIALNEPKMILLVDQSENALFNINREIEAKAGQAHFGVRAVLCDISNRDVMQNLIQDNHVDAIFHVAAYKHVRMVEENGIAGVRNNVFGTLAVADVAMSCEVKLFVLVSTDKAVRPTSLMGASKRVAEMVVQAIAARSECKTKFAIVRFGNVLGSSGSVVPIFREQISMGGPVTVTHPDVTRFFMLIPEAAQLVIQAAAISDKCEVFVLDMGESVNIMQLARSMIELAGFAVRSAVDPDGDIEIVIKGLSPGEKLYEELQIGNDISPTVHPRIMRSNEFHLPWSKLHPLLKKVEQSLVKNDHAKVAESVFFLARMG